MKSDIDEGQRLKMSQLSEKHVMVEKHIYKSDYRCIYSKRPIRYAFCGRFSLIELMCTRAYCIRTRWCSETDANLAPIGNINHELAKVYLPFSLYAFSTSICKLKTVSRSQCAANFRANFDQFRRRCIQLLSSQPQFEHFYADYYQIPPCCVLFSILQHCSPEVVICHQLRYPNGLDILSSS